MYVDLLQNCIMKNAVLGSLTSLGFDYRDALHIILYLVVKGNIIPKIRCRKALLFQINKNVKFCNDLNFYKQTKRFSANL